MFDLIERLSQMDGLKQNRGYESQNFLLGELLKVHENELMKLQVEPLQQQTPYSCVASVLQMLSRFYDNFPMTHEQAMVLARCVPPEGAFLEVIGEVLQRNTRRLYSLDEVRLALTFGHPVIADDNLTYVVSHAILITGMSKRGFYYIDPATGMEVWKHEDWFKESTTELYILPYRTDTKTCKNSHEHRQRKESSCS